MYRKCHAAAGLVVQGSVFLSGALAMSVEILIGRTLTPSLGGTITTWGALIAVFLAGMATGYLLGGRLADRRPGLLLIAALFAAAAGSIAIVPLASDAVVDAILERTDDMRLAALLCCLALAFLPAAVLAAVSPAGLRLVLAESDRVGSVSGRLSALATAGNIAGALSTSFFLIPAIGTRSIYAGLAVLALALALLLLAFHRKCRPSVLPLVLMVVATAGAPPPAGAQQSPTIQILTPQVVERVESEYATLLVERRDNFLSLVFGRGRNRYLQSRLDLDDPGALALPYTRTMTVALAYVPRDVRRIGMVGLGAGRTISYLLSALPEATADVAELDPAVVGLAKSRFGLKEDDRLRIHVGDGRLFLAHTGERFDLLLVDAYRMPSVPFHLTTVEFYRLAKSRLQADGALVQNVEPTTLLLDSIYATLKAVFANVDAYQSQGNVVLVAYDGRALGDRALAERARRLQDAHRFRYDLRDLLGQRQAAPDFVPQRALTDDFAPVEALQAIDRNDRLKTPRP